MKKICFSLFILWLLLTSCGSGPTERANDLCDCFKDAGVDFDGIENLSDLDEIGDKMSKKKGQKCVLAVLEGVEEDISDLDDEETGEYFRKFIKGMLDTECVSEVMEDMEFDDMMDDLKDEIKRMKKRMKDGDDDDYYFGGDASAEAYPEEYYDDSYSGEAEAGSSEGDVYGDWDY